MESRDGQRNIATRDISKLRERVDAYFTIRVAEPQPRTHFFGDGAPGPTPFYDIAPAEDYYIPVMVTSITK